jgi:hypothetical protein
MNAKLFAVVFGTIFIAELGASADGRAVPVHGRASVSRGR